MVEPASNQALSRYKEAWNAAALIGCAHHDQIMIAVDLLSATQHAFIHFRMSDLDKHHLNDSGINVSRSSIDPDSNGWSVIWIKVD